MQQIENILSQYQIDPERGFLPSLDPMVKLPKPFQEWDVLANNLSDLIRNGTIRERINELPLIKEITFKNSQEWERAMLTLSCLAHSYLHCGPEPITHLPASIAIPWIKVSNKLGRKPVLSHASIVLNNWKRIYPNEPIVAENLSAQCLFHGSEDEQWFYVVTVEIEDVGARAIPLIMKAILSADEENESACTEQLNNAIPILQELTVSLKKMYDRCQPEVFYNQVRPFLASFENIEFEGTNIPVQSHHGASAAQSSLLQFFDAAFGIGYDNPPTAGYLNQMRLHMPYKHAEFLEHIDSISKLKRFCETSLSLKAIYDKCIQTLIDFRNEHLKIVATYIMQQAQNSGVKAMGTGGTSPMHFLKSVRNQNRKIID